MHTIEVNYSLFCSAIREETMRTAENQALVLGIYNQKKDGLVGICVIPCKDIPTVTDTVPLLDANGVGRRRFDLAPFQAKESKAMQELARRQKSDHAASVFLLDFHKKYMPVRSDAHPVSKFCNIM